MDRIEHFEDSLLQLKLHLENLQACDTFEHFKACQTAFVTALVADQEQQLLHAKAERIAKDAADVFLHDTEFVTKLKDAVGKITETKTQWQVAAGPATHYDDEPCHGPQDTTCDSCGLGQPEPPARIDDAQPYDPVRQERAERRGPVVHTSSAMSNACDQEEGA